MGSGKTTVGRQLASALNWHFLDLDEKIEERAGESIAQIFENSGENHFRRLEADTLHSVSQKDFIVIATGGGAPCHHDNSSVMQEKGFVVFLQVPPKDLASRLQNEMSERPLIRGLRPESLESYIASLLDRRMPFYLRSHLTVDGTLTPEQVVKEIICSVGKLEIRPKRNLANSKEG